MPIQNRTAVAVLFCVSAVSDHGASPFPADLSVQIFSRKFKLGHDKCRVVTVAVIAAVFGGKDYAFAPSAIIILGLQRLHSTETECQGEFVRNSLRCFVQ